MRNNPISFIDPSGHGRDCGISLGTGCVQDPESGSLPPELEPVGNDSGDNSDGDIIGESEGPIIINIPGLPTIIIMPDGTSPSPYYQTDEQLELAQSLTEVGIALDFAELVALSGVFDLVFLEYGLSFADILVTLGSCANSGECYAGQPHPDIPPMLVVNQDVIVTGSDFFLPIVGGLAGAGATGGIGYLPGSIAVDVITTSVSGVYDMTRWTGDTPNYLSIGIDPRLNFNIIIYP